MLSEPADRGKKKRLEIRYLQASRFIDRNKTAVGFKSAKKQVWSGGLLFLITFLARRAAIRAQVADVSRAHQAGLNIAVRANRSTAMVTAHGFGRRFFVF